MSYTDLEVCRNVERMEQREDRKTARADLIRQFSSELRAWDEWESLESIIERFTEQLEAL